MFAFSPAYLLLEDENFLVSSTRLVTMDWSISMSLSSLSLIEEGDSAWGLFVEEGVSPDASLFSSSKMSASNPCRSVWNRHHDSSSIPFPWYLSKQRRSFFGELLQLIVFWIYLNLYHLLICCLMTGFAWLISINLYLVHQPQPPPKNYFSCFQKANFFMGKIFFWKGQL